MLDFLRNSRKSDEERRQETITAYLDGALTPDERQRFEQKLRADNVLRAEVEQQRLIKMNLRRLPRQRAPRNFSLDPALYRQPQPTTYGALYPALRAATVLVGVFFIIAVVAELLTFTALRAPAGDLAPAMELAQEYAVEQEAEPLEERPAPMMVATMPAEAAEALAEAVEAPAMEEEMAVEAPIEEIVTVEAEAAMPAEEAVGGGMGAADAEESGLEAAAPELTATSELEGTTTADLGAQEGELIATLPKAAQPTMTAGLEPPSAEEDTAELGASRSALPPTSTALPTRESPLAAAAPTQPLPTEPAEAQALSSAETRAEEAQPEAIQAPFPILRLSALALGIAVIALTAVTLFARSRR